MNQIQDLPNIEPTKNGFGYMHNKSFIMDEFVLFSKNAKKPVLDIGAAYGVATIKAINEGSTVIACDIDKRHLDLLIARIPYLERNKLIPLVARFPNETNFKNKSIQAVLLSHVLSFLEGDEIDEGIRKISSWLDDGGKLFILNYTPYHTTLADFISTYEKNKLSGMKWPGYLKDKRLYKRYSTEQDNVPNRLNLLDIDILKRIADENGFHIDFLKYIGGVNQGVPEIYCLDGKEWVGMIATKMGSI